MILKYETIKRFSKKLKIGAFFYRIYHIPKNFFKQILIHGALNMFIDWKSQSEMEKMATLLEPISKTSINNETQDIYFLTGKRFWYQTCFCCYSMAQYADEFKLRPVIYDDGSLSQLYQEKILRIFPDAKLILKSEIEERIDKYLPRNKFPYLRERRDNYPNIKKITDIHVNSSGWKLVLDSDMLFFRNPEILIDWLKNPQTPCHMVDVETSYGYSKELMTSLAQAEISERINVGICGLKSEDIDWEQLELWCKTMIELEGTHYFQEQALVAMLLSGKSCTIAPALEYIVMPRQNEVIHPEAILHHYVADSKPWYFRYGWRHVFKSF